MRLLAEKRRLVPFLLGANSFEASLMSLFGIDANNILAQSGPMRDKVRQFYGDDSHKAAQGLFTDAVFLGLARYLAAQMEKVKLPALPVLLFVRGRAAAGAGSRRSTWRGNSFCLRPLSGDPEAFCDGI